MSKKEVSPSNEERLVQLREQYEEVIKKREELNAELNALTTLALKLQGAIEILDAIEDKSEQKQEELSD
tara:strand:+ start:34 stop:240 length:207 start_codon:yes stop_codon:yes gene_type:complete